MKVGSHKFQIRKYTDSLDAFDKQTGFQQFFFFLRILCLFAAIPFFSVASERWNKLPSNFQFELDRTFGIRLLKSHSET